LLDQLHSNGATSKACADNIDLFHKKHDKSGMQLLSPAVSGLSI